MIPKAPTSLKELAVLLEQGESSTLEFKRSTGELKEGMQTLCSFLNGTCLPTGITVKQLSGEHRSYPVNPLIAGAFHRTGAVEVWGRGTNRVIDACKRHGAAPPMFEEQQGFVVVTLKVEMVASGAAPPESQPESGHQVGTKSALSRHQVLILQSCQEEKTLLELMQVIGRSDRTKFRNGIVKPLIETGLLALTIPDKPQSRLQKYRLTEKGLQSLGERKGNTT